MKSFKKYFMEYITGMFPVSSPILPDQIIKSPLMKLGNSMTFDADKKVKPIQTEEITKLIVGLLLRVIDDSLEDLKIWEDEEFINLGKKDLPYIKFSKNFDYIDKKIIINYDIKFINDEILDLQEDFELIQQKYDLIFNRQSI